MLDPKQIHILARNMHLFKNVIHVWGVRHVHDSVEITVCAF